MENHEYWQEWVPNLWRRDSKGTWAKLEIASWNREQKRRRKIAEFVCVHVVIAIQLGKVISNLCKQHLRQFNTYVLQHWVLMERHASLYKMLLAMICTAWY